MAVPRSFLRTGVDMIKKTKKKEKFPEPTPFNPVSDEPKEKKEIVVPDQDKPQVMRSSETGRASGVVVNGKTYLGLSPDEVDKIVQGEVSRTTTPTGAVEMKDILQQKQAIQNQQGVQDLISQYQFAQPSQIEEEGGIRKPVLAGLGKVATGVGLGTAGAAIGGALGTVPGALAGGAAGVALGSFIDGYTGKLKSDANEDIAGSFANVRTATTALNQDIALVNKGGDKELAWEHFQETLASIDNTDIELTTASNNLVNEFLSVDATKERRKLANFNARIRPILEAKMLMALAQPNPNDISDDAYINAFFAEGEAVDEAL